MDSDDVFSGPRAQAWCNAIGLYGDPLRMIVVNKLVARALNHFGKKGARQSLAQPHTLILESIAALPVDAKVPIEDQVPDLVEAHTDTAKLANEFPTLAGTGLLDLGSGSGHLGGWLSTLGVRYIGVEPSAELHLAAQQDPRLIETRAQLFQATLRGFCESNLDDFLEAPTLISIIGVLEHVSAPENDMRALFNCLARRDWLKVPVLVATFDPDFFLPGLPIRDFVKQEAAHYGHSELLGVRDPAVWEELFMNSDFHLLEQRPLHVSGLPASLSSHIQALHERLFQAVDTSPKRRHLGAPVAGVRMPPRQGPFYFWLLCPRDVNIQREASSEVSGADPKPDRLEKFARDEALSVVGNIGPRVYQLKEGSAFFESPETGRMDFGKDALFGQLETSCNYVSSRVLGALTASAGSQILTTSSSTVLRNLTSSSRFADELFLTLLHHLSAVQFVPFTSTRKSNSTLASRVVTGSRYGPQFVSNVAACLLQFSANTVASPLTGSYRSRILVELSPDELAKFVFGPNAKREADKLLSIFRELVQANVIDSFSAYALEHSGAQTTLDTDHSCENDVGPLHIGWQAARLLFCCFDMRNGDGPVSDVRDIALAISAYLGSHSDRDEVKNELYEQNQSELRSHGQVRAAGKAKTQTMPRTIARWRAHVVSLIECTEEDRGRVRLFLDVLHQAFNHQEKGSFAREHGLSKFMVIRDVWALLACLLDEGNMWNTARRQVKPVSEYIRQTEQRPRIIAYVQECVAHVARRSGLTKCPPD